MKVTNPKITLLLLFVSLIISCKSEKKSKEIIENEQEKEVVIDIVTEAMDIQMVDTISSGWHTFRYNNNSSETHLILFDKYPEGKSIKDTEHDVAPTFQKGMDLITQGKPNEGFAAFNELPKWFFDIVFSGGIGLISPGYVTEITMKLEPGYYVVECYVKMPNGVFHTTMGMATQLVVTENVSDQKELKANVNIEISSTEGITFSESIKKGEQLFSVFFKDQTVHENFLGHDINLVKVDKGSDITVLEKWINWAEPEGLISPSPKGFTFLGGVNDMPAGSTGYFKANLDTGDYVLISEVPNSTSKNMLKAFSIVD